MQMRGWLCLVALAMAGCQLFFKPSEEEERKMFADERDKKDLDELTALHAEAMKPDAWMLDVNKLAGRSNDIQRLVEAKKIPASWFDEMEAAFKRFEGHAGIVPQRLRDIAESRIRIAEARDASNEQLQSLRLKCVEVDPISVLGDSGFQRECFTKLKDDSAKVKACALLRPAIEQVDPKSRDDVFFYVMAECMRAAKSAHEKLPWPSAAKDEKTYQVQADEAARLRAERAANDSSPDPPTSSGSSGSSDSSSKKAAGAHCTDDYHCESHRCQAFKCATSGAGPGEVCQMGSHVKATCRGDLRCVMNRDIGHCQNH